MEKLLQLTVNGLAAGSIFAISAAGLTLVYGILKIVNFAHGDYLTFGAYMAFVANVFWGMPALVAVLFGVLVTTAMAVALEYGLWRPMRGRGAGLTSLFLTSIGLALVMRNAILLFASGSPRSLGFELNRTFVVGGVRISSASAAVILSAVVIIAAVGLFLARTRTGKSMRAIADNIDLASVSGIDPNRVVTQTWLLAGGLAGLAGILLAIFQSQMTPSSGWFILLPIFAAVVLGGVGSAYGALTAGLVLGLVMELSTYVVPFTYKNAVAFGVMILALLIRPQGLFGKARVL